MTNKFVLVLLFNLSILVIQYLTCFLETTKYIIVLVINLHQNIYIQNFNLQLNVLHAQKTFFYNAL